MEGASKKLKRRTEKERERERERKRERERERERERDKEKGERKRTGVKAEHFELYISRTYLKTISNAPDLFVNYTIDRGSLSLNNG